MGSTNESDNARRRQHAIDELGVSALLHTPGHLDDGTPLDYAWALGVRMHAGRRIYRHGGGWPGLSAQLVRIADRRDSFVILALDDEADRTSILVNAMIEESGQRFRRHTESLPPSERW